MHVNLGSRALTLGLLRYNPHPKTRPFARGGGGLLCKQKWKIGPFSRDNESFLLNLFARRLSLVTLSLETFDQAKRHVSSGGTFAGSQARQSE